MSFQIAVRAPNPVDEKQEQELLEKAIQMAMDDDPTQREVTRETFERTKAQELHRFTEWDKKLWDQNPYSIGFNGLMSERAQAWGAMPGVNSGDGQFESRMPMTLFLALGQKYGNSEWWKDDALFYAYLREHPEHDGRRGKHKSQGGKLKLSEAEKALLV